MSRPVPKEYPVTFAYALTYSDPRLPSFLIGKKHKGVDYGTPVGTPTTTGVNGVLNFWGFLYGFGNTVITKFWTGTWPFQTTYRVIQCHLDGYNGLNKIGQKINKIQIVAYTGNSGWSTGPHMHFQVEKLMLQKPDLTWTDIPSPFWKPIRTKWIVVDPSIVIGKD